MEYSQIRVLVVDDEDAIRESLAEFLADYDFVVSSAASAEEAIALFETIPFDAAIVDLRLPGISGDAMIARVAKTSSKTQFIIHTGSTNFSLPEELINLGMTPEHIFLKPQPDLTVLVDAILELLKQR